jgi:signal transduction histidine kinase
VATCTTSQHSIFFYSQGSDRQVWLDPTLLQSMLTHLLSNAIGYFVESGKVAFELTYAPKHLTFSIQDEGIGIPLEDQGKLFSPFHRGSNIGNSPETGMELAIVKQCVEQCQGVSQVNQGTLVRVTLPFASLELSHDQDFGN